jgi:hypothetical protein
MIVRLDIENPVQGVFAVMVIFFAMLSYAPEAVVPEDMLAAKSFNVVSVSTLKS